MRWRIVYGTLILIHLSLMIARMSSDYVLSASPFMPIHSAYFFYSSCIYIYIIYISYYRCSPPRFLFL
jgi:hypothetical protein